MPTPTDADKKQLDDQKVEAIKEIVGPVVADAVEEKLAEARENGGGSGGDGLPPGLGGAARGVERGEDGLSYKKFVGRAAIALAAGKGDPGRGAQEAERKWGEGNAVAKALTAADEEGGGFLIEPIQDEDVIEFLRPNSVVRQFDPVIAPMDAGQLRLPKMTAGSSGGYVGESSGQNADQPEFGMVELTAKKYVSIVPLSNDLVRRGGPRVEQMVEDDISADIATSSDLSFIRGDGTGGAPQGVRHQAAAANVIAASTHDPAAVTLANVTADLGRAIQQLMDADVNMIRPGWIIEPRTWRYLITVRDGNGNLVFKPEMDDGTLFGFPFQWTSQIPRNLDASGSGGGDETEVYFTEWSDVVIGETTGLLMDVRDAAAYQDATGNVVAGFSRDESVVRGIIEHDIGLRHDESVVVLDEVVWGA